MGQRWAHANARPEHIQDSRIHGRARGLARFPASAGGATRCDLREQGGW